MQRKYSSMPNIANMASQPDATNPQRWEWVERSVWTERMLNALNSGVKGGKWHSLIDKVYSRSNLDAAYNRVASNNGSAGVDHVSLKRYSNQLDHNQFTLSRELKDGTYTPRPVRRTYIGKPGSKELRPLGIPCVRDRIGQTALKYVLEPIFENTFNDCSYGFRPGRSCKDALRIVEKLLRQGYNHIVDADIKGYFDNISQPLLLTEIRKEIGDGRVLDLLETYLQQGIFDGLKYWTPESGTPQGSVISPLLANIFLNPFDWYMQSKGIKIVRYADDFILLCRSAEDAQWALDLTQTWMQTHHLTLHPDKTTLVDMTQPRAAFTFLGYEILNHITQKGKRRLIKRPGRKAKARIRARIREKTPRKNGHSLECIIKDLNRTLRGWYGYFKHCSLYEFPEIDQMIRRRLRRMLRKRIKRHHGSGRSIRDSQRWPNSFFAALGLFSLEDAQLAAVQSLRRKC